MRSLSLYTAMFVCVCGLQKSCRGCVDKPEARVAPGSTVQVYSSWWTVYLCSSTTGPSKVCVLYMCTHCLLPRCGDFYWSKGKCLKIFCCFLFALAALLFRQCVCCLYYQCGSESEKSLLKPGWRWAAGHIQWSTISCSVHMCTQPSTELRWFLEAQPVNTWRGLSSS